MKKIEKINIIKRYKERLNKFGNNVRALATGTKKRRDIRYKILTEIGIRNGDTILDYGCGMATYFDYLKQNNIKIKYTGVDISEDLINIAKIKHPNLKFIVGDIKTLMLKKKKFDYAVCSQVFNHKYKFSNNTKIVKNNLIQLFGLTRKGLAIDFLTNDVDFKEKHLFYHSPDKMFNFSRKITNQVTLKHNYKLFEFCLYLFPKFTGWKK